MNTSNISKSQWDIIIVRTWYLKKSIRKKCQLYLRSPKINEILIDFGQAWFLEIWDSEGLMQRRDCSFGLSSDLGQLRGKSFDLKNFFKNVAKRDLKLIWIILEKPHNQSLLWPYGLVMWGQSCSTFSNHKRCLQKSMREIHTVKTEIVATLL